MAVSSMTSSVESITILLQRQWQVHLGGLGPLRGTAQPAAVHGKWLCDFKCDEIQHLLQQR